MIQKFFDTSVPDTASSNGSPEPVQATNIAALMAKEGIRSENGFSVEIPQVNKEAKEEPPKPAESSPVATTVEEPSKVEKETLETQKQAEAPKETPKPQIAAEQPPMPTLQEVLKSQKPEAVLRELGYDDKAVSFLKEFKELDPKMQAFFQTWKENGDVSGYLKEMTTDYNKLSAEDIMRHKLQQEYPKASSQQLDALYKREVVKAYSLDSDDEDEVAEGRLLLESKADKYREEFIQNQNNFLLPKPPEPKPDEPDESAILAQQQFEVYKSRMTDNAYTKNVFANKKITVGEGESAFNFPIEPEALTDVLFTDKWTESLFDKDGSPKVEHQLLVATVNKYGYDFINALAEHFQTIGNKKSIAPIENASAPDKTTPSAAQAAPKSPAEAMARFGTFR